MGFHQSADTKLDKLDCLDLLQFQGLHLSKRAVTEILPDATKTVDVQDDGKIILCAVTTVITLPGVGSTYGPYVFVNYGVETDGISDVQINISPNGSDKLYGPDIAAADDKDFINTLATARRGDMVRIEYADGTGWRITEVVGTWAIAT